jgi:hypothetical protein
MEMAQVSVQWRCFLGGVCAMLTHQKLRKDRTGQQRTLHSSHLVHRNGLQQKTIDISHEGRPTRLRSFTVAASNGRMNRNGTHEALCTNFCTRAQSRMWVSGTVDLNNLTHSYVKAKASFLECHLSVSTPPAPVPEWLLRRTFVDQICLSIAGRGAGQHEQLAP